MTDYQKYINALRKCAKEHEGDRTFTGQIIVSNLCQDTANLLEELEQESSGDDVVSRDVVKEQMIKYGFHAPDMTVTEFVEDCLPTVNPKEPTTKNDLSSELEKNSKKLEKDFGESDCISRADARKAIIDHQYSDSFCVEHNIDHSINTGMALIALSELSPVTPQEPTDKKITKAELDSIVKAINEGWELRVNEVLGKIRAEILKECGYSKDYVGTFTYSTIKVATVLRILDKYKAEREGKE